MTPPPFLSPAGGRAFAGEGGVTSITLHARRVPLDWLSLSYLPDAGNDNRSGHGLSPVPLAGAPAVATAAAGANLSKCKTKNHPLDIA